jgi:hypothetical protein
VQAQGVALGWFASFLWSALFAVLPWNAWFAALRWRGWRCVSRAVRPNGAMYHSPGHRPGFGIITGGRSVGTLHRVARCHRGLCSVPSERIAHSHLPRALPWAGMRRSVGARGSRRSMRGVVCGDSLGGRCSRCSLGTRGLRRCVGAGGAASLARFAPTGRCITAQGIALGLASSAAGVL